MNHITFNQDFTCIAICNNKGFFVFNSDPFRERFSRSTEDHHNLNKIALLFRSNILAYSGKDKSNIVIIWDDYQNKCIAELEFKDKITGIKIRRDTILISSINKTYIYNFADLKLIHTIETVNNELGIIDISRNSNRIIATLGKEYGYVTIKNLTANIDSVINAHSNPISLLALNNDGNLLATCSNRGTIIRLWNTTTGLMIKEFRRGLEVVQITSMYFDNTSTKLLVCSTKGTIHIYNLNEENKISHLNYFSDYLPQYFNSEWSSISFQVPPESICSFGYTNEIIYAISNLTKQYYKYIYNKNNNTYECIETQSISNIF